MGWPLPLSYSISGYLALLGFIFGHDLLCNIVNAKCAAWLAGHLTWLKYLTFYTQVEFLVRDSRSNALLHFLMNQLLTSTHRSTVSATDSHNT